MSNIIDGIDYGMGFEKATEPGPDVQNLSIGGAWINRTNAELPLRNNKYRRPLPIISQHPGAIPLEPGEDLKEGERYLMRNGEQTGPLCNSKGFCGSPEIFPWYSKSLNREYKSNGSYLNNQKPYEFDIIARLPNVEQKEPEEKQDGDRCSQPGCRGVYEFAKPEKCFCHLSSPCSYCVPMPIACGVCGDNPNREISEPEKAKEEKVEEPLIYLETVVLKTTLEGRTDSFLTLPLAARIAQLPEVIAEVEIQRKEKEIKVGDNRNQVLRDALAKIQAMTDEELEQFVQPEVPNKEIQKDDWFSYQGSILKCSGRTPYWVQSKATGKSLLGPAFCTKITDPSFIALLEKGEKE